MRSRKLAVPGAVEFRADVFPDNRGLSASPYQESAFVDVHGRPLFRVAQTLHSTSRRGVVRGVHFTATPPGGAKYAYCPHGSVLDVVVDLRVGSPTFGVWDAVRLDDRELAAVYLPVGVGHAFRALADDTVVAYLLSTEYVAEREHTIAALDPALGLPLGDRYEPPLGVSNEPPLGDRYERQLGVGNEPLGGEPIMSERDRTAPTLAEARAAGQLPDYARCVELDAALGAAVAPGRATNMP